jgi:hypothetical protein
MSLIRRYPLVEFFGLAYALSWILESPLAYAPALLLCKILHTHTECVDNHDQAPLLPAPAPQNRPRYSPG